MRILFVAEGATMAHFVRPLFLAESLDCRTHSIHFCAPSRYSSFLRNRPYASEALETLPSEQFLANLEKGAPLYSRETLRSYVRQDREIIRRVKPDLVIGDLRLSLPISARLEDTRFATLMNAYWSPSLKRPKIIPDIPLTRALSPKLINPLFQLIEPLVSRIHVGQMNQVRREFGVPALPPDFGRMYLDADFVLYPDVPEFIRLPVTPPHHRYLGICEWTPPAGQPAWWDRLMADARPKVLVALGSSGPVRVLPRLISVLREMNLAIVLATSGRSEIALEPDVYAADLLPLSETIRSVDLVVSHGGSPVVYPALAAGRPNLAIPSNADQHLCAELLRKRGAGLRVRAEEASPRRLRQALERLLHEPAFREVARSWQAIFARYESKVLFQEFIDSLS